jgi:hypothetical protein
MDPLTLALIGAGLFAAVRIKQAAAPPSAPPEVAEAPESIEPGGIPPHAFGGRGLRPPVTHRGVSKERNIEGTSERGGRGLGEEPADVAPIGLTLSANYRAQEAIESGGLGDVVGGTYRPPASPTTYDPRSSFGGAILGTQHQSIYPTFGYVPTPTQKR